MGTEDPEFVVHMPTDDQIAEIAAAMAKKKKKKAGVLPEWYTEKHAKGDGYLSLEEAEHDAAVNGWAEDLRENDYAPAYPRRSRRTSSGTA